MRLQDAEARLLTPCGLQVWARAQTAETAGDGQPVAIGGLWLQAARQPREDGPALVELRAPQALLDAAHGQLTAHTPTLALPDGGQATAASATLQLQPACLALTGEVQLSHRRGQIRADAATLPPGGQTLRLVGAVQGHLWGLLLP